MTRSVEIRLALPQAEVERALTHPLLRDLANGAVRDQRLDSVYFDTPRLTLLQQRAALRMRWTGERRLQTVKAMAVGGSEPYVREAWETDAMSDLPCVEAVAEPRLRALIIDAMADGPLIPVFETHLRRTSVPLAIAETKLELDVDRGEIIAGIRREGFSEIEIKLVDGEPVRLFELALALAHDLNLRPEPLPKSARGRALAMAGSPGGTESGAVFAPTVDLTPKMTTRAALVAVLRSGIQHLVGNLPAEQGGLSPESVHQLRVATRRLRSAVTAFGAVLPGELLLYLKGELGWLQSVLGPAREWDVFLTETLAPLVRRRPAEPGLILLDRMATARKDAGYAAALAAVGSARFTRLLLVMELWIARAGVAPSQPHTIAPVTSEPEPAMLQIVSHVQAQAASLPLLPIGEVVARLAAGEDLAQQIEARDSAHAGSGVADTGSDPSPGADEPSEPDVPALRLPPASFLPAGCPLAEASAVQVAEQAEGLEQPAAGVAAAVLDRRHRRLRKLGRAMTTMAIDELHAVRIEGKKLRYLAEFFASLFGRKAPRRYLDRLRALQDCFGSLQDAVVADLQLKQLSESVFGDGTAKASPPAMAEALAFAGGCGLVAGWHAARIEADLTRLSSAWDGFVKVDPFWE